MNDAEVVTVIQAIWDNGIGEGNSWGKTVREAREAARIASGDSKSVLGVYPHEVELSQEGLVRFLNRVCESR